MIDQSMPQTREHKKALRARLKQALASMDAQVLRERSAAACEHLIATPEFQRAGALMMFLPLPAEIDAQPVAVRAWQMGKTVTLPLVSHQQRHMIPIEVRSLDEPMDTDAHGLRTPSTTRPIPVEMIDLVVVPGLGFDAAGHRLGRGGGFYDRFLSQPTFGGVTCGLALDEQVLDDVPVHGHDVSLDMLATDRQVYRFNHRPVEDGAPGS